MATPTNTFPINKKTADTIMNTINNNKTTFYIIIFIIVISIIIFTFFILPIYKKRVASVLLSEWKDNNLSSK